MKTLNKCFLIGSCGRDPDIRTTAGGAIVANLSIATQYRYKDKSGNWVDEPCWHSLVAFARTAEVIRDYVTKGSPIHVEGRLTTRSWDKDGQKHYRTEIIVENLILLGTKDAQKHQRPHSQPVNDPIWPKDESISDDDIPF